MLIMLKRAGMVFGELEFVPRTGTDHKPDAASRASEDDG